MLIAENTKELKDMAYELVKKSRKAGLTTKKEKTK